MNLGLSAFAVLFGVLEPTMASSERALYLLVGALAALLTAGVAHGIRARPVTNPET